MCIRDRKKSGCHGFCEMGPLLRIEPAKLLYLKVSLDDCEEIVEKSIVGDEVIERLILSLIHIFWRRLTLKNARTADFVQKNVQPVRL